MQASGLNRDLICRAFTIGENGYTPRRYAWMCADMQRFGNFAAEVPKTRPAGSIPAPATRKSAGRPSIHPWRVS
jgi:hypothetical protein